MIGSPHPRLAKASMIGALGSLGIGFVGVAFAPLTMISIAVVLAASSAAAKIYSLGSTCTPGASSTEAQENEESPGPSMQRQSRAARARQIEEVHEAQLH